MFLKKKPMWGKKTKLKSSYDVVIIGGGLHSLATAYFLAKEHGITDIAIIEKNYIGFGGAGRNTAIVRANQRTQYNVPLYKEALDLWPVLTKDLDYNLMFNNCGNLNLMHSEAAMKAARMTIATAQFHGVESHLIDAKEAKELVPALNISEDITFPIHGAMFHPPGGVVRHDAVVWGLARGAAKKGVEIHQQTEALGIGTQNGKVTSVTTSRGVINTKQVLISAGGYSAALIYDMLGIKLPISVLTIQAMVTQPLKPVLDHVVSSGAYHCYANQTLKGEIATGAHMDPWPNYTTLNTAHYIKHQAEALSEFLPCLRGVRFMRIWGGLADMTPDMAPIMEGNNHVEGFFMDCGWGYFGFKSCSAVGKYMAEYMATDVCPDMLKPFALKRYQEHKLMGETAELVSYSPDN
ncbi:MAG: FAD-dependent oxidoreductase [Deltaproteobacteria bacterium]|uniref:NAD(P)/FAD-dependent oxidoreductase n=1 Tax=Desulfobacula sp. TaxID=2593537 RepID=UPI0019A2ABCE|nr:FAD-dependent oxidoreductase [Candidatus Desulfobacula maris]MBL6992740.1 FAD-dependent oxidoreductase [Desulfobacula sp.]